MIASFFRHLEEQGVRWLLVSGQATILYGAATFSEDIDLWVEPSETNLQCLLSALRASQAKYYKLTPALTPELANRHHGFHFTISDPTDSMPLFLDVMCCPPRVGSFAEAAQRARVFTTDWGALPTVGIADLVELKKTQRPRDYPIIGRLVLAHMSDVGGGSTENDLAWAANNIFSLPEFKQLLNEFPQVDVALSVADSLIRRAVDAWRTDGALSAELEDQLEDWFDARSAPLRKADRRFWRVVIDELRELRAGGQLIPQGTPV